MSHTDKHQTFEHRAHRANKKRRTDTRNRLLKREAEMSIREVIEETEDDSLRSGEVFVG